MGKRLPYTPNSKIRSALRQLWMRSRERLAALKRDKYTCRRCGAKQSRAKGREVFVEVHHRYGVSWDKVIQIVREMLLQEPEAYETLCVGCHLKETESRHPCGCRMAPPEHDGATGYIDTSACREGH